MADVMTPEQRSRCMAAIKGKDTKPEIFGAEILVQQGASVSSEQQKASWLTGYCIEEIQDSHICRWLLLARP